MTGHGIWSINQNIEYYKNHGGYLPFTNKEDGIYIHSIWVDEDLKREIKGFK